MARDPIRALVVGIDDEHYRELTQEEGFTVEAAERLDEETDRDVDAVVVTLDGRAARHARDASPGTHPPPP